jgi:integrase
MPTAIYLSDLIDGYEQHQRALGLSVNTRRAARSACRRFLASTGNIQARYVSTRHIDDFFATRVASGVSGGTLNNDLTHLRLLFDYAVDLRLVPTSPLRHRRRVRQGAHPMRRLPATRFGDLLDACSDPRDRALVALGLYLWLRQGDITALRIRDVSLQLGDVATMIAKTGKSDVLPVSTELDAELRRWLTAYALECGPLRPDWFLVPARSRPIPERDNGGRIDRTTSVLRPTLRMTKPERVVKRALESLGFDLRDGDGRSRRDGMHTLRRSAARAKFDELADGGYDGALRVVQSMLGHSSSRQTEVYLGLELDKAKRDELIRGKDMFHVDRSNVVQFQGREVTENAADAHAM